MKRFWTGLTDPGLLRSVNQDAYLIDPDGRFFIVADGMGGHAGGQEASAMATKTVAQHLHDRWDSEVDSVQLLTTAIEGANNAIVDEQMAKPSLADMGTTVVVVMFRGDRWWRGHVGDSRIYRWHEEALEQLTADHTWVARAVLAGDMTQEQARLHPWRHVLMQCLGRPELESVEVYAFEVEPGDAMLLCSDGLTEELSDSNIAGRLASQHSLEDVAAELVAGAKAAGGRDNITVVLVQLGVPVAP